MLELGFFGLKKRNRKVLSIDAILHIFQTFFVQITAFQRFSPNVESVRYPGVSRASFKILHLLFFCRLFDENEELIF